MAERKLSPHRKWYGSVCLGVIDYGDGLQLSLGGEERMGFHTAEILSRAGDDPDVIALSDIFICRQSTIGALQLLSRHPKLRKIGLGIVYDEIQPPEWDFLTTLPSLQQLELWSIDLAVHDLEVLASLKELHDLRLYGCRFPEGIGRFGGMQLNTLYVTQSSLSPTDVEHITSIHSLTNLYLEGSPISDKGMAQIAGIPCLEELHIESGGITIRGFEELTKMRHLAILGIGRPFSDRATLRVLGCLTQLKQLSLFDAGISESELKHLQEALPDTYVWASG